MLAPKPAPPQNTMITGSGLPRLRDLLAPIVLRARRLLRTVPAAIWATRAESLLVLAILGTWAGATQAAMVVVTAYLPEIRGAVYPAAIAVLCASGAGWKFLVALARDGLYVLTHGGDDA